MHLPKIHNFLNTRNQILNWPNYFLDHWLKKSGKRIYQTKDGAIYIVRGNTDDRYIINEIYIKKLYGSKGFEIKKSDTVIDIGGHIGVFSIYASKKVSNGRVYCFEPTKENFNLLCKNLILSEVNNVVAHNKAVSSKKGLAEISIAGNTGGHSLQISSGGKKERVQVTTLSDIMKENKLSKINFLKMDCEGAEYDIIFKSPKNIFDKIDKIVLEYHNLSTEKNGKTLKEYLEKLGYTLWVNKESNILYAKRF